MDQIKHKPERIGMYGGTFSPPHLGHLRAADFFAASHCLDKVLIFPTGTSPLKERVQAISNEDRFELCKRTFTGEIFEVNDWELRQPGLSYTIETLRYVCKQYPQAKLFLLIGEDQKKQFHLWEDWQEILRLAELVVLPRYKANADFAPLPISSTKLRAMLAKGEDVSPFLAPEALYYIHEKGLYAYADDTRRLP